MPEITESSDEITTNSENSAMEKHLVFSILDKLYSFPSNIISEIVLFDTVYPLPLMPNYVLGVINRYSIPYALFDIGFLLYNTPCKRKKILVLKDSIDRIAFLIDDVSDITDVPQDKLIKIERSMESSDITEAVYASFNQNGSDIFVLDIEKIMARIKGDTLK